MSVIDGIVFVIWSSQKVEFFVRFAYIWYPQWLYRKYLYIFCLFYEAFFYQISHFIFIAVNFRSYMKVLANDIISFM